MKESEKWAIKANAEIDQLRAELEDDMEILCSMIVGLDKNEDDPYIITATKLAHLFLLELVLPKMKVGEPLRCGISTANFVKFLNNEIKDVES